MSQSIKSSTGIENGVTLYHPYLEFHNLAWLKQTLLLWDSVRRIVPADYHPQDADEVRTASDVGAILNTDPMPYVKDAGERFLESWTPARAEKLAAATTDAAARIRNGKIGSQVGLWHGKVSQQLAQQLKRDGTLSQEGNWYLMDGTHAGLYMTCLSATIAESMGITCCTDRAFLQMNAKFFSSVQSKPSDRKTPHDKWISLGFKLPIPENVADIPMEEILKFRAKHIESMHELRALLSEISNSLGSCKDENQAQDLVRSKAAQIDRQLDDHRQRLSDFRVKATTTLFRIDRPAVAISAAAYAAAPNGLSGTLALCAGFALGIADWWVDLRTAYRDLTRANPWHYLNALQQRFGN